MSEANKAVIRKVREEGYRAGRLHLLDGYYAHDYVYHGPAMTETQHGLAALKEALTPFLEALPDFQETVVEQIAEGDRVATRLEGSGTHQGPLLGVAPTGRQITWTAISFCRFRDGKIAEEWVEFDGLNVLQQLGALDGS
jgi:steroid delta-isomerase-like uncharacterized protein